MLSKDINSTPNGSHINEPTATWHGLASVFLKYFTPPVFLESCTSEMNVKTKS